MKYKIRSLREGAKCIKCSNGVLRNTQWNRLVCSSCVHSELV